MGGTVLTDEEFTDFVASVDRYSAAAIDENLNVVQDPDDPLGRGNHSCDPTLWMADAYPTSPPSHPTVGGSHGGLLAHDRE